MLFSQIQFIQVVTQRLQYKDMAQGKQTPLTRQRKELLDSLDFVWKVRNRPEWASKLGELIEYKSKNGDTVSQSHYIR
jgi:hypothetical protein